MKLKNLTFTAGEDLQGFYKSVIPKGTQLFLYNPDPGSPVKYRDKLNYRFIFDTIEGATAHNSPKGNKRVASFYIKGEGFEEKILQKKAKKVKYDVLSPDGFSIRREGAFNTEQEREEYFSKWCDRYKAQGYYSASFGRIPLDNLRDNCKFITI